MVYKEEVVVMVGGGVESCRDSKDEQQFDEYVFLIMFSKIVEKRAMLCSRIFLFNPFVLYCEVWITLRYKQF